MGSMGVDGVADALSLVAAMRTKGDELSADIKEIVFDLLEKRNNPDLFGAPDEFNEGYTSKYDEGAAAILGLGHNHPEGKPGGVQAIGAELSRLSTFISDSMWGVQDTEDHNNYLLAKAEQDAKDA